MKIKNNINKNIGKVVYIVEGDNDEPKLIIDIFQIFLICTGLVLNGLVSTFF